MSINWQDLGATGYRWWPDNIGEYGDNCIQHLKATKNTIKTAKVMKERRTVKWSTVNRSYKQDGGVRPGGLPVPGNGKDSTLQHMTLGLGERNQFIEIGDCFSMDRRFP